MEKRGLTILIFLLLALSLPGINAEEDSLSNLEALEEEFPDADLADPGAVPGDTFYFLDELFSFGDNSEERAAEIIALIESGASEEKIRRAYENYLEDAERNEEEADPESIEEARRRAAAIHKAFKAHQDNEFTKDILEQESKIITAVEISSKIKELCLQLSNLDPSEFYQVCKTESDSPKWQKDLFNDLTEEQEKEAKEFFRIMSQCFDDPRNCKCDEISLKEFAAKCDLAIPLAIECDLEDNEAACDELDDLTEDIEGLLPPHLQRVLSELEDFEEDKYEKYGGPKECEGINNKAECEEKLFRSHAPPECLEEIFEKRGLEFSREFGTGEAERICNEIMFDLHAPEECTERGITDPEECARLMSNFKHSNKPNSDLGFDCRSIEDAEKRLACYDGALSDSRNYGEEFEKNNEKERECAEFCSSEGGEWSFSGDDCECHFPDRDEYDYEKDYEDYRGDYHEEPEYDCSLLDCQEGSYCDPFKGCVSDEYRENDYYEEEDQYNEEERQEDAHSEESQNEYEDQDSNDEDQQEDHSNEQENDDQEDNTENIAFKTNAFLKWYYS